MKKYILKRILIMIPVFLGMTALVFFLSNMTPGSPVDAMITPEMGVEDVEQLRHEMGLDQPIYVQYFKWLERLFQGNLGYSYRTSNPVIKDIGERIGPTLILTLTVLVVSILFGVALGVLAACKPYSIWDTLASGLSFIGSSMPGFFIALVLIYFFSVKLRWLPTGGMYTSVTSNSFSDLMRHMVLPTISMSLASSGNYIRQTRSAMLEVMGEEYVKMARAKGLRERVVLYVHALRNAMLPIVTCIGMSVPGLVGGSIIIEQIFGWPGMGTLMVLSVTYRDYPVIMGITMYITIAVLLTNLLMDLLYAVLDPRIRN
ncbi:MAG: ABC transporter permease [Clostridia bacterium]|nr:ABC transporter permease [Clostridia bacterium]